MGRKHIPVLVGDTVCRDLKTAARRYGFRYIFAFRRLKEARRLRPVTIDGFTLRELEPAPVREPERVPTKPRAESKRNGFPAARRVAPPKGAPAPVGPALENMIRNCPGWARGWGPSLRPKPRT
jgi:hypothetical protein